MAKLQLTISVDYIDELNIVIRDVDTTVLQTLVKANLDVLSSIEAKDLTEDR